jgi:hypothetical protein
LKIFFQIQDKKGNIIDHSVKRRKNIPPPAKDKEMVKKTGPKLSISQSMEQTIILKINL